MDQFSKLTKLIPMKNQSLETIMETLRVRYFNAISVLAVVLTDNAGQFITNRWSEYAEEIGFSSHKTRLIICNRIQSSELCVNLEE